MTAANRKIFWVLCFSIFTTVTGVGIVVPLLPIYAREIGASGFFIGMIFGAARGVLMIAALVLLAGLTPFPGDPWWQESRLIPYFEELAVWLRDMLPEDVAEKFRFTELAPQEAAKVRL